MESRPPTRKQERYLRDLAVQRGETFAYPQTFAEASAEIERLKARRPEGPLERALDRLATSRAMAERGGAPAFREDEIAGYGSECRWR